MIVDVQLIGDDGSVIAYTRLKAFDKRPEFLRFTMQSDNDVSQWDVVVDGTNSRNVRIAWPKAMIEMTESPIDNIDYP